MYETWLHSEKPIPQIYRARRVVSVTVPTQAHSLVTYHWQKETPFKGRVVRAHDEDILQLLFLLVPLNVLGGCVPQRHQLVGDGCVLLLGSSRSATQRNHEPVGLELSAADPEVLRAGGANIDEATVHNEPRRLEGRGMPVSNKARKTGLVHSSERENMMKLVSRHV